MRKHERLSTTIVIPTRNRFHLLQDCVDSILPAVERAKAEILIVDNDSTDPALLAYLAEIKQNCATVLHVPGEFNFPTAEQSGSQRPLTARFSACSTTTSRLSTIVGWRKC